MVFSPWLKLMRGRLYVFIYKGRKNWLGRYLPPQWLQVLLSMVRFSIDKLLEQCMLEIYEWATKYRRFHENVYQSKDSACCFVFPDDIRRRKKFKQVFNESDFCCPGNRCIYEVLGTYSSKQEYEQRTILQENLTNEKFDEVHLWLSQTTKQLKNQSSCPMATSKSWCRGNTQQVQKNLYTCTLCLVDAMVYGPLLQFPIMDTPSTDVGETSCSPIQLQIISRKYTLLIMNTLQKF